MYKLAIMLTVIIIATSQTVQSLDQIQFDPDGNAIQKTDLFTDDLTSGFLLFIKKEVKSHVHMHHSETAYVLAGTANFYLGDKWLKIKTGDIIFIPKETLHSVLVTSTIPLKVISIQSPKFIGKDRIFKNIIKE